MNRSSSARFASIGRSAPARAHKRLLCAACAPVAALIVLPISAANAQRVFGLDTSSAANGSAPSPTAWTNAFNDADGDGIAYKFAFLRALHSSTTDDSHFYTSITRATTAGLLAGSYDFVEPDINTAAVDAQLYLDKAGMYMKPGYLLPVLDLEHGNSVSASALTTWSLDFCSAIFTAKGINPIVYTNSSYNNDEVQAALAWINSGSTPKSNPRTYQWLARPGGSIKTAEPQAASNYPNPYGVWDPNFISRTNSRDPAVNPWAFWQNGSGSPNGFLIDHDAANGNIEFVKDFLVPALWTNNGSGDWGTTANWNSDNPGYIAGNTATGPAPRLPNNSNLDWVKLQNAGGGIVTISSGAQTVRKLYTQQPLNINGGSLSVSYTPGSGGQFDLPSEFNAAVTLSTGAAYSAFTTQVDGGGGQFVLNGGTVTFRELQLASHASNSGKITLAGNVTFAQQGGAGTSVIRSIGSLAQAGSLSIPAGASPAFTVNNGSAAVDLNLRVAVTGAGRLTKSGPGTMQLTNANSYSGGTTINGGVLQISADDRLGVVPGVVQSNNIILDGGTLRTGAQISSVTLTNPGSGYTSFPTLAINNSGGSALINASANVLAGITSISVPMGNGGSGYVNQSSAPAANTAGTFVDIVGGGGSGATAFATVSGGVVTGINIISPGTGYTSMPTIHISSTGLDTDPGTATALFAGSGALALVNGIALQSVSLSDGGFGYNTPSVTLTGGGGTGATASPTTIGAAFAINANRGIQLGAAGGTLEQTTGTTLSYAGVISGSGALTKIGAGTLRLDGANTYTGATTVSAGRLSLGNNLTTSSSVNVTAATLELLAGGGNNRVIKTPVVSIGAGGKIDIQDNKLIVTSTPIGAANSSNTYSGITGMIQAGRASGNWSGNGIVTSQSTATITGLTSIGVASAAQVKGIDATATTVWAGQTVSGSDALVMYTYAGDANLDGKLDVLDYGQIDLSVPLGTSGWFNGDFNYDGKVDVLDYGIIDFNIGIQGAPFLSSDIAAIPRIARPDDVTSVPEPALPSAVLLSAMATFSARRRRRGARQ